MPAKRTIDHSDAIIKALLNLAARRGWATLTLADIAKSAKISESVLKKYAADKSRILVLLEQWIEAQAGHADIDPGQPSRDRIFEALMNRFDVLQDHRDGMLGILNDLTKDPCDLLIPLPILAQAMGKTLARCHLPADGWAGMLRIIGLSAVYAQGVRVWINDDSEDLTKTMAALDQAIARAERLSQWMKI
jgi:ubiquinone biosynthesis protein COQ9